MEIETEAEESWRATATKNELRSKSQKVKISNTNLFYKTYVWEWDDCI